jgi:hypothetical protein
VPFPQVTAVRRDSSLTQVKRPFVKTTATFPTVAVACDRYVTKLRGVSPPWTLVRGTVREGKGVHREVESEESCIQNADLTNRKCR